MKPLNAPGATSGPVTATTVSTDETGRKLLAGEPLTPAEVEHLFQLDAIAQQAIRAAAGRSNGATRRNQQESRIFRDKVAKAVSLVSLHDLPDHDRVDAVRKVFLRYGPEHFGLAAIPDDKTIRRVIDDILNK